MFHLRSQHPHADKLRLLADQDSITLYERIKCQRSALILGGVKIDQLLVAISSSDRRAHFEVSRWFSQSSLSAVLCCCSRGGERRGSEEPGSSPRAGREAGGGQALPPREGAVTLPLRVQFPGIASLLGNTLQFQEQAWVLVVFCFNIRKLVHLHSRTN